MSYDNIIPLFDNCFISTILKELGIRKKSYPFDWSLHNSPTPKYSCIESNILLLLELLDCGNIEKITNKLLIKYIDNNKINENVIFSNENYTEEDIQCKYRQKIQILYDDITNINNTNLFIIITKCYLINNELLINLYNKLMQYNPVNQIIFVSDIDHNLDMKYFTNLSFKHIYIIYLNDY